MPLCYILYRSLLASQFRSDFCPMPALYADIHLITPKYLLCLPQYVVSVYRRESHAQCPNEGSREGHIGGKTLFMDVRTKISWRTFYCVNQRPDAGTHSRSQYHIGIWSQSTRIIREYELATAILIRLLIQPCTYKIGSSIFTSMSRLRLGSTARAHLSSITSTEIMDGWN